jgi:NADPH2:quinone reductase
MAANECNARDKPAARAPANLAAMNSATDTLALVCERLSDDLSGLALRRWPLPGLGLADVRVAVHAVSLNFPDLLMTRGLYQFKPPLPFVPGMEGAGVVLEAGPDSGWLPGQRVCLGAKHGLLAEQAVLPGSALRPMPAGLGMDDAACATVTGLTAWVALARLGRLARGETLLVHGARGGVGQACVQLGQHLGARVIATASQPVRLAALAALGVLVLPAAGFKDGVLAATEGRGADVVADPVGGDVFDESLRCIGFGGRLLVLGFASGRIPVLDVNRPLIKGYSLIGVRAGEYGRRFPQHHREHLAAVLRLAETGVLRPAIGVRYGLAEAQDALAAMAARTVTGKILVKITG